LTAAVCVASLVGAFAGSGTAIAQDDPSAPPANEESPPALEVPDPVAGEEACAIADQRLVELSGLVATDDQYIVVNDSTDLLDRQPIFFLNQACEVVDQQDFLPGVPRDPEDLELDPDNATLWVADTGDNPAAGLAEGEVRPTVALWKVDLSGGDRTPVIHRFVYPDGQARDAEALLVNGDGTPIIVTKQVGTAQLYVPTELVPDNPPEQAVPLELVGEFSPPETGSENPLGAPGRQVITGGTVSPDRSAVVLRTYADAFEFDVADGDVVAAISTGQPRVTPLPDEPLGEAIAYEPDGQHFLTVSDTTDDAADVTPVILRYTPTPPAADPPPVDEDAAAASSSGSGGFSLFNNVQDIINLIAAVGVVGLLLVAVGVFGIMRARRRPPSAAGGRGGVPDGDDDGDGAAQPANAPVMGRARLTGEPPEPGWEPDQAARGEPAGGYTSNASPEYPGADYRGTEYGGAEYGGAGQDAPVYAGTEYGGTEYGGSGHGGGGYGGREYGGGEYGRSGYPDQPFDQDWADGGDNGRHASGGGYPDQGRPSGYGDEPAEARPGGETYRAAQPSPDYYPDDPDYPYEFRERGRW
jgi:hypothetical protein